jgi:hypothetical protein
MDNDVSVPGRLVSATTATIAIHIEIKRTVIQLNNFGLARYFMVEAICARHRARP